MGSGLTIPSGSANKQVGGRKDNSSDNVFICVLQRGSSYIYGEIFNFQHISRGTKVEKMLTLAPERYTAGFCMVAKVIQWCI